MESKRPLLAALAAVVVVVLGAFTVTQLLSAPVETSPVPQLTPAGATTPAALPPRATPVPERAAPAAPPEAEAPAASPASPSVKPDRPATEDRADSKDDGDRDRDHRDRDQRDRDDRDRDQRAREQRDRDQRDRDERADRRNDGDRQRTSSSPAPSQPARPNTPAQPPVDPATGLPARAPSGESWAGPPGETAEQRKARLGRELLLAFCDKNKIPRDRCHPPQQSTPSG